MKKTKSYLFKVHPLFTWIPVQRRFKDWNIECCGINESDFMARFLQFRLDRLPNSFRHPTFGKPKEMKIDVLV